MRRHVLASLRLPALLMLCASATAQGAPVATPLADAIPELANHSTWAQDASYEGAHPDKGKRGVYPVGNGRVFGYVGLGARANTMQGVTGPSYQTAETFAPTGHFGAHSLILVHGERPLDLPAQRVRRVRGANFVVTVDEDPAGLSLRTLSFAPPDGTAILRVIEVQNLGTAKTRAALRVEIDGVDAQGGAATTRRVYDRDGRRCHAEFGLTDARRVEAALVADLGDLAPGAVWRGVLQIATYSGAPASAAATLPARARLVDEATKHAMVTQRWWQSRLKDTAYFDTDHAKLRDLVQDWKVLMLVQRDASSGVVSSMVNHRGFQTRENSGAILTFLRLNMWAEAKAILKYTFDATRLLGSVPDRAPLDLDFAGLTDKQIDWDAVAVPEGDAPSWIILQHFWYWRVTRDTELIKAHRPLLLRCLVGQKRMNEVLQRFGGQEPWLHGVLGRLYPERVGVDSGLVADDREHGRGAFSFIAAVQMLLATQAIGELDNGIDAVDHPERYTDGDPKEKPGQRYLTRSFALMQATESVFWIPDLQMFAPAISPVNGEPHRAPLANANLMPLWLGWTFPTGEKSRDNLRSALQRLWRSGGRVGATPTSGFASGHTQGQLLTALAERDAKERHDAFDALLAMAEPAGEWGELYDPQGRPTHGDDAAWPNRLRPFDSGINLDALLFAVNGIRFVTVPNWDARDIRAELRLPRGASYVTMRHVRKDQRDLDLYWRETQEKMTDDERTANAEKEAEKQRDPEAVHRRLRFRVDLVSENPKAGYYDVGLNAVGTLFVRWLQKDKPLDEVEYWADDTQEFMPPPLPARDGTPIEMKPEAKTLYLASRAFAGELVGGDAAYALVDTGLPMRPDDLAAALVDADGKRRVDTLFFDWNADGEGKATLKPAAFWASPVWREALEKFTAGGGQILRPRFVRDLAVVGGAKLGADSQGRVEFQSAGETTLTTTITAAAATEAVLRMGSSGPAKVWLGDKLVFEHGTTRIALPDQDSALVQLAAGANEVRIVVQGTGTFSLFLRASDSRGLPVPGVK